MKGGYQVIDLSEDPFVSGVPHTVHGAYNMATVLNNNKVILLEGITLGASSLAASTLSRKNAEWVSFIPDGNKVTATLKDSTTVEITNADAVTVTEA